MASRLQMLVVGHRRLGTGAAVGHRVTGRRMSHSWIVAEECVAEVEAEPAASATKSNSTPATSVPSARTLAQMIDEYKITAAMPDWLPLVPGSSYWIPPAQEDKKPSLNLSNEKLTSFFSPCGWPRDLDDEVSDSEDDEL